MSIFNFKHIIQRIKENPEKTLDYRVYRAKIYFYLFNFLKKKNCFFMLNKKKFYINPESYTGKILFAYREIYEIQDFNIIKKHFKNYFNCIDIGANVGIYSTFFAERTKGKVFCFEKDNKNFEILKKNMRYYKNYKIYNKEVGIKKNQLNLSNLIKIKIHIIKIDIDGLDYLALLAADKIIKKHKPFILIEISEDSLRNHNIHYNKVFNYLKKLNYMIYDTRFPKKKLKKILLKNNEVINLFAKI